MRDVRHGARNGRGVKVIVWVNGEASIERSARNPESRSHTYQIGQRISFHFLHDLASVRLDRDFGNSEFATNLFI
jgi:hypothetical protein